MHNQATAALIVAGATLLVAHISALDPQVSSLTPILQSPWLSSHVTTIMISYCLFAMLLVRPDRTMLIWAEVLLATGIILGAIWAKTAWGGTGIGIPKKHGHSSLYSSTCIRSILAYYRGFAMKET